MSARAPTAVELPESTIDLHGELVPAVRALLHRGLSDDFQRQCVRIGAYSPFGGGQKATLVGALRLDVNAAIKLGGIELHQHRQLMDATNRIRANSFPSVVDVAALDGDRCLLIMADLRRHVTLLDLLYRGRVAAARLRRIVDHVIDRLAAVRRAGVRDPRLARLPREPMLFRARLRAKLQQVLEADPELQVLRTRGGTVMGVWCPPLDELLPAIDEFVRASAKDFRPALQHGDPHLGNIMVRRAGAGYAVTLIDPNPEVGFTDPLYDVGKLFHWAEPVGWTQVMTETGPSVRCKTTWRESRAGWSLDAACQGIDASAEWRRRQFVRLLRERVDDMMDDGDRSYEWRLPIAIAAAHVGLAALKTNAADRHIRRFALAHAMRHLATWRRQHRS